MKPTISLFLRANERVFINGAVLKTDRKVTLELLNDASFLLESYVLQVEQATTPLRRLYFIAQSILIDPVRAQEARATYSHFENIVLSGEPEAEIVAGLKAARDLLDAGKTFETLRVLRGLFALDHDADAEPAPICSARSA